MAQSIPNTESIVVARIAAALEIAMEKPLEGKSPDEALEKRLEYFEKAYERIDKKVR